MPVPMPMSSRNEANRRDHQRLSADLGDVRAQRAAGARSRRRDRGDLRHQARRRPSASSRRQPLLRRVEILPPGPPEAQAQRWRSGVGRGPCSRCPCLLRPHADGGRRVRGGSARHPVLVQRPRPRRPQGGAGGARAPGAPGRLRDRLQPRRGAGAARGWTCSPTLVPHGVDLRPLRARGAPTAAGPLRLLAVGRCVEKKGFADPDRGGRRPRRRRSTCRSSATGRSARVARALRDRRAGSPIGSGSPARSPTASCRLAYAAADVVVAPSIEDAEGDRDGLPNVVLEAMASGPSGHRQRDRRDRLCRARRRDGSARRAGRCTVAARWRSSASPRPGAGARMGERRATLVRAGVRARRVHRPACWHCLEDAYA